jgi:AcrR family transcriptional regulator
MNGSQANTQGRVLDAAERLFAEHGFEGASIRAIVDAANVNLAAVHYHFKSKEALLEAVLLRRISVINEARLKSLDAAEAAAAPKPPSVEAVVRAFIIPTVECAQQDPTGATFVQLMSRMFTEPKFSMTDFLGRKFGDAMSRFTAALTRALPQMPAEVVMWRAFFAIGAMHHLLCSPGKIDLLSKGLRNTTSDADMTNYLIEFSVAGICATTTNTRTAEKAKSKMVQSRKHK